MKLLCRSGMSLYVYCDVFLGWRWIAGYGKIFLVLAFARCFTNNII